MADDIRLISKYELNTLWSSTVLCQQANHASWVQFPVITLVKPRKCIKFFVSSSHQSTYYKQHLPHNNEDFPWSDRAMSAY